MCEVPFCYYCGMPADSIDHVVPQVLLDQWRRLGDLENLQLATGRGRTLTVDCCRQCNCLLSDKYDATLAERKERLKVSLRRRYRKLLEMPEWTPSELEEMGPRLRQYIEAAMAQKAMVRKRIGW